MANQIEQRVDSPISRKLIFRSLTIRKRRIVLITIKKWVQREMTKRVAKWWAVFAEEREQNVSGEKREQEFKIMVINHD